MMLAVAATTLALWGLLSPGPHAVGFQADVLRDPIRRYDVDRKPRPVLAAMWYPAQADTGAPLKFHDYLELPSPEPSLDIFVKRLMQFTRAVVIDDLFQRAPSGLSADQRATLDRLMSTVVHARRSATPLNGPFPLILYSHGSGGTYEEDSVLFEYLASHGYVVISTAFQCSDAAYLGDCLGATRMRDLDLLARHAATLPLVDMSRVALMGHSAGGQTSIQYAFRDDFARAVISFDSTIEQWGLNDKRFEPLRRVMEENDRYRVPTLLFAPMRHTTTGGKVAPKFSGFDEGMKFADRYEVTVDGLAHDEYLSDGVLADAFLDASQRRRIYEQICTLTLRFLDLELKGAPGPLNPAGDPALSLNRKPPHRLPPTALELLGMFDRDGPEKTRQYLEKAGEEFDGQQLFALGHLFLADGRTQDALRISRWAVRYWPKHPGSHEFQGEVLAATGDVAKAREEFKKALELVDADKSISADEKATSRAVIEKTMRVLPQ